MVTNVTLLALATVFVGLRLYSQKLRGKALAFHDYAIILSLVFSAGLSAVEVIGILLSLLTRSTHQN